MHDWLRQTRVMVANGSGLAKAIDYSLKRWEALSRYATDGRLPIDNNPVENMIRPIALGQKELVIHGIRACRQTRRGDSNVARHRKTQWPGSGCVVA